MTRAVHNPGRNRLKLTIVAFLLSFPIALHAEPFDWRPVNFQIAQLLKQGRFDDALPMIEATVRRCPDAASAREAGLCSAILSENRSEVLEHRGDLAGAEADLRTMIAERSRALPDSDKLTVQAWLYLIGFLRRHDRATDEEAALAMAEHLALADPAQAQDAALLMQARANLLFKLGRPADSVELFHRAIAFARASPGVAPSLALEFDLANVLLAGEDNDALFKLTRDMLAASRAPPLDPVSRLRVCALLGMAVTAPEQARAALPLFRTAAAADMTSVDALVQFDFLNGWAHAASIVGDPAQALSLTEQARRLAENSGNLSGKRLVQLVQRQADALGRLGRRDEAMAAIDNARTLLAPTDLAPRAELAVTLAAHLELGCRRDLCGNCLSGMSPAG